MSSKFAVMALAAHLMPEEMVLREMEEAISDMRSAVLDSEKREAKAKLAAICSMYTLKLTIEGKSMSEVMDDFDKFESMTRMMNPGGN